MTGQERTDLKIALDFLHEWRNDDKLWKARTDKRLTMLETRNVAVDAVIEDVDRRRADTRWKLGLLIGIVSSLGVGLVNLFIR